MERISARAAGTFIPESSCAGLYFTHYSHLPLFVPVLLINMLRLCGISVKSKMIQFRPINSTAGISCHGCIKLINLHGINKRLINLEKGL